MSPMADAARPPKVPLREMQKVMTRERVVEAALHVFDAKGFTATTMDDIASEAALNRATIYLHFENKTQILRAAVAGVPEVVPLLLEILSAPERATRRAAFARLHALWAAHLAPVWGHLREAAVLDASTNEWLMGFVSGQTKIIQRHLEAGGVARRDARARGFMLMCLMNEFVLRMDESGLGADAAIDALTDFFEAAAVPR